MSLPPGFLDELRQRLSIAQVVGRKVTWDLKRSNQAKGDFWGPCPFHHEKTASFHVDDRKGFYHCFGCHASGDAISFVRETENAGFMEAVEILAGEVGMQMPARDPGAQEKINRLGRLAEVMEAAIRHYRLGLKSAAGGAARDYLQGRGLGAEAWDRWELGFAPEGWQGLWDALKGQGIDDALILEAGLAKPSTTGRAPYDVFRNRIMFPIRDARGRAIAFGGRAMDAADRAKYLNSPETPLFDKGRSLYNHQKARATAGGDQPLVVAEGYMDVIALAEAGFAATVAPLGTAITADQLALLWRLHPEPVIALDGDTAGIRAAMRLVDLALPMLEPGRTLRFALMPEGQDPDDLIRARGRGAMDKVIAEARPLVALLWQRETEGRVFDSPERRAALDQSLRAALKTIPDVSVRSHYGEEIQRLRRALFAPPDRDRPGPWRGRREARQPVRATTRGSALAATGGAGEDVIREAVILATLILHPALIDRFESALETLDLTLPEHDRVRGALLANRDRAAIEAAAGAEALEKLHAPRHVRIAPTVARPGDDAIAAQCVEEELAKIAARRGALREIAEAMEDLSGAGDEAITWRLGQAAKARDMSVRSTGPDRAQYDVAENGVKLNRDEKRAFDAILKGLKGADGPE